MRINKKYYEIVKKRVKNLEEKELLWFNAKKFIKRFREEDDIFDKIFDNEKCLQVFLQGESINYNGPGWDPELIRLENVGFVYWIDFIKSNDEIYKDGIKELHCEYDSTKNTAAWWYLRNRIGKSRQNDIILKMQKYYYHDRDY